MSRSQVLQDLSVLVAEADSGSLIHFDDPAFAMWTKATSTIRSILDRLLSDDPAAIPQVQHVSTCDQPSPTIENLDYAGFWSANDFRDFELDFWLNLADHPSLT